MMQIEQLELSVANLMEQHQQCHQFRQRQAVREISPSFAIGNQPGFQHRLKFISEIVHERFPISRLIQSETKSRKRYLERTYLTSSLVPRLPRMFDGIGK
jgi:hypothetical protein